MSTQLLREYAPKIMKPEREIIVRTPAIDEFDRVMAEGIGSTDRKRKGRTDERILSSVRYGNAIERAVLQRLGLPFPTDATVWKAGRDIETEDAVIECKSFKDAYFSFKEEHVETLEKHLETIDLIVCGNAWVLEDRSEVFIRLVFTAKSFMRHKKPSKYKAGKSYYDHRDAVQMGRAVYMEESTNG